MAQTQIKKLYIHKFRALHNVEVEFGDYITVICGKNGTSKSSILGIAAQIFSFKEDYVTGAALLPYKQISGQGFKSKYSEHIRISERYDVPGSMSASIILHDGYTNQDATANLELMRRTDYKTKKILPRFVIRNNSIAKGNTSRNFTHPVIFLSLKRLYPIADRDYKAIDFDYLKSHETEFIALTNELLNRSSTKATGTHGTITSAVSHGDNYDHESVSAGEDNAGQIIMALLSFKKLQAEYADYKGGLLLIDEADAGLFPTAQVNLLKIFERECRKLNLQVVMTSHSPIMIEYAYEKSQHKHSQKFKTVYLCNTFGKVEVKTDWSWARISADIHTRPVELAPETILPLVNVYFEDKEAEDFFAALIKRQPFKKCLTQMSGIKMGCTTYLNLLDRQVPEFSVSSVNCLDEDAKAHLKNKDFKTVVILPGHLPPDHLIFEHLYNLPPNDDFWKNNKQFTRDSFTNTTAYREVIRELGINGDKVDLKERQDAYQGNKKKRDIFKNFYNSNEIQPLFAASIRPLNAWSHWIKMNPTATNVFLQAFRAALYHVMKNGYAVDDAKLSALEVKLKKVPHELK